MKFLVGWKRWTIFFLRTHTFLPKAFPRISVGVRMFSVEYWSWRSTCRQRSNFRSVFQFLSARTHIFRGWAQIISGMIISREVFASTKMDIFFGSFGLEPTLFQPQTFPEITQVTTEGLDEIRTWFFFPLVKPSGYCYTQ